MLAGEVVMVPQEVQKMGTLMVETRGMVSQLQNAGEAYGKRWDFWRLTRSNDRIGSLNW